MEVSEAGSEVFVSFYQNSNRGIYALQSDQKVLGWHIVQDTGDLKRPSQNIIGSAVRWESSVDADVNSSSAKTKVTAQLQPRYARNRFVSMSVTFASTGKYLLVPSTWDVGDKASFLISIVSKGGVVTTDVNGNVLPSLEMAPAHDGSSLNMENNKARRLKMPSTSTSTAKRPKGAINAVGKDSKNEGDKKKGQEPASEEEGGGEGKQGEEAGTRDQVASNNVEQGTKHDHHLVSPAHFEKAKERFLREVKICKLTPRHASALFVEGSSKGRISKKAFKHIMLTAGATISSFPDNFFRDLSKGDSHSISLDLVEEILHCEEEEREILNATQRLDKLAKDDDLEYAPTELCGKITLRILEARALKDAERRSADFRRRSSYRRSVSLVQKSVVATTQSQIRSKEEAPVRQKIFVEALPMASKADGGVGSSSSDGSKLVANGTTSSVSEDVKSEPIDSSKFAMTAHKLEAFQVLENERTMLLKKRLERSSAQRSKAESFVRSILVEELLPGGKEGRLDAMLHGLEQKPWDLRSWRVVGYAGSDSSESRFVEPSIAPGVDEIVSHYNV